MACCTLHSHGDQSLLKILLKRQHLTAQEILKYFLSVCSELVVAFGPEDVGGRTRVEKISETVAKCCQRGGIFFMCKPRLFRLLNIIYLYRRLLVFLLY